MLGSMLNTNRDKAPGQRECDEAIEVLNNCIREVDQASLAAISQQLTPRDDISHEVCICGCTHTHTHVHHIHSRTKRIKNEEVLQLNNLEQSLNHWNRSCQLRSHRRHYLRQMEKSYKLTSVVTVSCNLASLAVAGSHLKVKMFVCRFSGSAWADGSLSTGDQPPDWSSGRCSPIWCLTVGTQGMT